MNDLSLHHIHGYRGFDARNNVHFINEGSDIVYHAAGAAIILNVSTGELKYYFSLPPSKQYWERLLVKCITEIVWFNQIL